MKSVQKGEIKGFLFNIYLFMLAFYLGTYTLFIALLWWLFIVAKIHAYKFKSFSHNIGKVTNFLLFFLIFLTILWYILIFFSVSWETSTVTNYWTFDDNSVDY